MTAYLTEHPPARQQWYERRTRPLTGCTVLHTAESLMDTVGPDTGAESVADFIRGRSTPGSYHDLVDRDSWVHVIDYEHAAFHDGTGSNNWALSLSFACRTSDWAAMTPAQLDGFLAQGARAFVAQQAWRAAHGYPLTELRLITKADSDRGESGFTYHGWRDPGRRSDPGVHQPHLFPIDRFIEHCRAALAGGPISQEDDMFSDDDRTKLGDLHRMMDAFKSGPEVDNFKPFFRDAARLGSLDSIRGEGVAGAGDVGRLTDAVVAALPAGQSYHSADDIGAALAKVLRDGVGG